MRPRGPTVAVLLAAMIAGCGGHRDAPPTAVVRVAPPLAAAPTNAPPPEPAPATPASAATFSPEIAAALTEALHTHRVFRHLLLGNMPVRARHTWMLSRDGLHLTLACEREHAGRIEKGRPDPEEWYLESSAWFVALAPPEGRTWARRYRRAARVTSPKMTRSDCVDLGEELELDCSTASVEVFGPNAHVVAEARPDEPLVWRPSARRRVAGLQCTVKAGEFDFWFYDFPASEVARPALLFGDVERGIERLVHSGAVEWVGFRESGSLEPFRLPRP